MHGGFRQGAGRKQGFSAKSAEEGRRLFAERVAQELGPITDVLVSKAKEGDIRAIRELLDRAWGRPQLSVDLTSLGDRLAALPGGPDDIDMDSLIAGVSEELKKKKTALH